MWLPSSCPSVAQLVSLGDDPPEQTLVSGDLIGDHEEGRASAVPFEHRENLGCGLRIRSVVDGERHHGLVDRGGVENPRIVSPEEAERPFVAIAERATGTSCEESSPQCECDDGSLCQHRFSSPGHLGPT